MSALPHIRVIAAEIEQEGAYLLTQRRAEAELPGLWEFPGGRVREGESDEAALRRAILDRLGVGVRVGHQVLLVSHAYEGYKLDLAVYRCAIVGVPKALRVQDLRWVKPEDFGKYSFPKADQQTVDALLRDG